MRATQRYLVTANASIFGLALCLILFLNLGRSSENNDFDWNTVRYRSTARRAIVESNGVCSGLAASKKPALVVSHVTADGDTAWLDGLSVMYHLCVYEVDGDKHDALKVPANRGHEAMAYLTFVIDNYDNIPEPGAVFVHGSRFAWHNDSPDYDNAALLRDLNISSALELSGYHNLRCDWSASTCGSDFPPQGSLETIFKARLQPWDARAVSDAALVNALVVLFGSANSTRVKPGRGHTVRSQCCAQFAVSRQRVHQHSREEYVGIRQWLMDAAPRDDRVAGRILSYVWHILFLQDGNGGVNLKQLNAQACPSASECYCRLYGRCGLEACTAARCYGQYEIPKDFTLPKDWAALHGGIA